VVLLRLRRTFRYDGFLTLAFGAWYGAGRFMEDFFRVDETHGTGLTGSQWTALTVLSLCLFCLVVLRDTPWRSGKGEFASIPRRHGATEETEEPAGAELADVPQEEPVPGSDQPREDAE
jgi:hypothetical protein